MDVQQDIFTYALSVKGLQVNNQQHTPSFPVILNPVKPRFCFYNTSTDESNFFLIFKCEIPSKCIDKNVIKLSYVAFAVHELDVRIEEEVLMRLFMWMPKGGEKKNPFI